MRRLKEITDVERALFEAIRIRKEIDGLIAFLSARVPGRESASGSVEVVDPRTGRAWGRVKK